MACANPRSTRVSASTSHGEARRDSATKTNGRHSTRSSAPSAWKHTRANMTQIPILKNAKNITRWPLRGLPARKICFWGICLGACFFNAVWRLYYTLLDNGNEGHHIRLIFPFKRAVVVFCINQKQSGLEWGGGFYHARPRLPQPSRGNITTSFGCVL